jgi:hypothetical protein
MKQPNERLAQYNAIDLVASLAKAKTNMAMNHTEKGMAADSSDHDACNRVDATHVTPKLSTRHPTPMASSTCSRDIALSDTAG